MNTETRHNNHHSRKCLQYRLIMLNVTVICRRTCQFDHSLAVTRRRIEMSRRIVYVCECQVLNASQYVKIKCHKKGPYQSSHRQIFAGGWFQPKFGSRLAARMTTKPLGNIVMRLDQAKIFTGLQSNIVFISWFRCSAAVDGLMKPACSNGNTIASHALHGFNFNAPILWFPSAWLWSGLRVSVSATNPYFRLVLLWINDGLQRVSFRLLFQRQW